jgi:hypothetical protein
VVEVLVFSPCVSGQFIGELGLEVTVLTSGDKFSVDASGMFQLEPGLNSKGPVLVTLGTVVAWHCMRCLPSRSPCPHDGLALGTVGSRGVWVLSTAVLGLEPPWVIVVLHSLSPGFPGIMAAVSADSIQNSVGLPPVSKELFYLAGAKGPLPALEDGVV